ncbi:uncharacterized protein LOC125297065 isoform X3 [Alosa alosa]|uniref:uncharacterized protein LOC125297065 isoform X3 n=1 Tax=Alosa alosa TaxID=278164 RepID=UPI002015254F|nr:uncharacterized protein LOC125297065 isoform X3 [Alosa alosa]
MKTPLILFFGLLAGVLPVESVIQVTGYVVPPPSPMSTTTEDHTLSSSSSSSSGPTFNTSQFDLQPTPGQWTAGVTPQLQEGRVPSTDVLILCTAGLLAVVMVCGLAYRLRGRKSKGNIPPTLRNRSLAEDPNDYEMTEEPESVPGARESVSTLYCLADQPHQPSVTTTGRPFRKNPEPPIYFNSEEDPAFPIYANETA